MAKMDMKYTDAEKAEMLRSKDFDTRLQAIKGLSSKDLVTYGTKEFATELPLGNGRTWLVKKVSYLELERSKGGLSGKSAERLAKLDTAAGVKECKDEESSTATSTGVGADGKYTQKIKPSKAKREPKSIDALKPPKKNEGVSIGKYVMGLFSEHGTDYSNNATLAEEVRGLYDSNTSPASIAWYRNKARKDGGFKAKGKK